MKQKRLLLALALTGVVLTACTSNPGFELVDVHREESSAGKEETKTITEIMEQEFPVTTEVDASIPAGEYKIVQKGERGKSKITYEVQYRDGREVGRKARAEEVLKKPIEAIVKIAPTPDHDEIGAREIIGYSQPKASKYVKPAVITTTSTPSELVLRILADSKALEKDDRNADESSSRSSSSKAQSSSVPEIRIVPMDPDEKPIEPQPPSSSKPPAQTEEPTPPESQPSETEEPTPPEKSEETEEPAPPEVSEFVPNIVE
ncbi:G5 domain-containing protein [Murdochiella massiliensis]|uniref:G5 domain-containing protein n=1 Tax=Murdochiella massiliensis TaxID=1673723 RepID=UPI00082ADF0F|nr:G5 domain-containing protein [Murdochiella massiliensis]